MSPLDIQTLFRILKVDMDIINGFYMKCKKPFFYDNLDNIYIYALLYLHL